MLAEWVRDRINIAVERLEDVRMPESARFLVLQWESHAKHIEDTLEIYNENEQSRLKENIATERRCAHELREAAKR